MLCVQIYTRFVLCECTYLMYVFMLCIDFGSRLRIRRFVENRFELSCRVYGFSLSNVLQNVMPMFFSVSPKKKTPTRIFLELERFQIYNTRSYTLSRLRCFIPFAFWYMDVSVFLDRPECSFAAFANMDQNRICYIRSSVVGDGALASHFR